MSTDNGGSGVNAVAIIAIMVLVMAVGFFLLKSGVIGGSAPNKVDVKVQAPAIPAPAPSK